MGAGPPAPDPPKPAAPGLTCPGLCQATLLTGNAGALRGQRPRRLLLREQTCVMRELTVYRAAHTQPPRLPRCLAKPAHPACWDKFPGRRHSPQVRRGELEEQPLLCSPRKQQHAPPRPTRERRGKCLAAPRLPETLLVKPHASQLEYVSVRIVDSWEGGSTSG